MLSDMFPGLSVVALGLIIPLVILLIKDPKGVIKNALFKKKTIGSKRPLNGNTVSGGRFLFIPTDRDRRPLLL